MNSWNLEVQQTLHGNSKNQILLYIITNNHNIAQEFTLILELFANNKGESWDA